MMDETPELMLEMPDGVNEALLGKIAERTGVTVSMLQMQPDDVLQMMQRIYIQTAHDDEAFRNRMGQLMRLQNIQPMKSVEESVEQNANQIDGVINNRPQAQADDQPFYLSRKKRSELSGNSHTPLTAASGIDLDDDRERRYG